MAPLGAGEVREVCRVRDKRLGPDVAVTIIPAESTPWTAPLARPGLNHSIGPIRIAEWDVARGTAMLAVFLSHFLDEYFLIPRYRRGAYLVSVAAACRVATPAFVLLSGIVVGYLYRTTGTRFAAVRLRLVDKGLFVLTAGHVLIALFTAGKSSFSTSISQGYVTDTLAFCLAASLLLLPYLRSGTRLVGGAALCVLSWLAWDFWLPVTPGREVLKEILLGPDRDGTILFFFPLLPWFGVHLMGGYLGERLSAYRDLSVQGAKMLAKIGATALITVVAARVGFQVLFDLGWLTKTPRLYEYISPYQKYPPGPVYLLFFGGSALLLIAGVLSAMKLEAVRPALKVLQTLGRNSLLAFLLQYFVYYTVLHWLVTHTDLITPTTGPLYLLISVLGLLASVWTLDKVGVQRVWTVGLPQLVARWPWIAQPLHNPSAKDLSSGFGGRAS